MRSALNAEIRRGIVSRKLRVMQMYGKCMEEISLHFNGVWYILIRGR